MCPMNVLMLIMRMTNITRVDLNLLAPLAALLDERVFQQSPHSTLRFEAWHDAVSGDLEHVQ
jgi:hypothetical protein